MLSRKVTFQQFIDAAKSGGDAGLATVNKFIHENRNNVAAINAVNQDGDTALIYAANNGHTAIVTALLAKEGIAINKQGRNRDTALHWAAYKGRREHKEIAILLLARITDINILKLENNYHRTPEQEAINQNNHEIVTLIRERARELESSPNNLEEKQISRTASLIYSQQITNLETEEYKINIPKHLQCPISMEIMNDPITISNTGHTYDRDSLRNWSSESRNTNTFPCPVTRKPINKNELKNETNFTIKDLIEEFVKVQKKIVIKEILNDQIKIIEAKEIQSNVLPSAQETKHYEDAKRFVENNLSIISEEKTRPVDNQFEDILLPSFHDFPQVQHVHANAELKQFIESIVIRKLAEVFNSNEIISKFIPAVNNQDRLVVVQEETTTASNMQSESYLAANQKKTMIEARLKLFANKKSSNINDVSSSCDKVENNNQITAESITQFKNS